MLVLLGDVNLSNEQKLQRYEEQMWMCSLQKHKLHYIYYDEDFADASLRLPKF
jgi:hypothetical protein